MKKCIFATSGHLSQICDFTLSDSQQSRPQSASTNEVVGAEITGMEPARGGSDAMEDRGLSPARRDRLRPLVAVGGILRQAHGKANGKDLGKDLGKARVKATAQGMPG